jgi:uncharacterized protein YfaS (alpha-2-macroglobulin family)
MLYFSTMLSYYTADEDTAAQGNSGLELTREYLRLRIDESGGKTTWKLEPLSGEVRSGDLVVVRLKLKGEKAQRLLIEDPIPAGCEQVESVSSINLDHTDHNWSDWYSAREFRDDRTVFFLNEFDGAITLQYAMRVQIPGDFHVNPARAELMYRPSVSSNTTSARFSILDKK